ncbi:hypothetical protein BDQ12DRAFT_715997 [Crucibulum laeve]|uniref:DUF6534 domain-containing protein n=1 Tax=Crucibulum laeve TaxID=68775 RepID=A0A5C3LLH7_9AGAR|nr:hypothetical protein BDQ12DRAFT_715997 [Crucibulum laeve]
MIAIDSFVTFASGFGDPKAMTNVHLLRLSMSLMGAILACIVQLFYAFRIRVLSENGVLPLIIVALALTQCGAGISASIITHNIGDLTKLTSTAMFISQGLRDGATVICDIAIALSMLFLLRDRTDTRDGMRMESTEALVVRILKLSIATGSLTALFVVLDLSLYFGLQKKGGYFVIPCLSLGKIYSNSMMAMLNNRIQIIGGRNTIDTSIVDMDLSSEMQSSSINVPIKTWSSDGSHAMASPKLYREEAEEGKIEFCGIFVYLRIKKCCCLNKSSLLLDVRLIHKNRDTVIIFARGLVGIFKKLSLRVVECISEFLTAKISKLEQETQGAGRCLEATVDEIRAVSRFSVGGEREMVTARVTVMGGLDDDGSVTGSAKMQSREPGALHLAMGYDWEAGKRETGNGKRQNTTSNGLEKRGMQINYHASGCGMYFTVIPVLGLPMRKHLRSMSKSRGWLSLKTHLQSRLGRDGYSRSERKLEQRSGWGGTGPMYICNDETTATETVSLLTVDANDGGSAAGACVVAEYGVLALFTTAGHRIIKRKYRDGRRAKEPPSS